MNKNNSPEEKNQDRPRRELHARAKWFRERIGKVVFRNDNGCDCPICKGIIEKGLIIADENHADYLYEIEAEYNHDGFPLKYFDTKEEATEFSVQQKD